MKTYGGSGGVASLIPDLAKSGGWVMSFTVRPLPPNRRWITNWISGCVGLSFCLDYFREEGNLFHLPRINHAISVIQFWCLDTVPSKSTISPSVGIPVRNIQTQVMPPSMLFYTVFLMLGAFARLQKPTASFIMSVRPSFPSTSNTSAPTGRIFIKFDIWLYFEHPS